MKCIIFSISGFEISFTFDKLHQGILPVDTKRQIYSMWRILVNRTGNVFHSAWIDWKLPFHSLSVKYRSLSSEACVQYGSCIHTV